MAPTAVSGNERSLQVFRISDNEIAMPAYRVCQWDYGPSSCTYTYKDGIDEFGPPDVVLDLGYQLSVNRHIGLELALRVAGDGPLRFAVTHTGNRAGQGQAAYASPVRTLVPAADPAPLTGKAP